MPRVTPILASFAGGEIAPEMYARVDIRKHAIAARKMENIVLLPQGPATRIPGTRFVCNTRNDLRAWLLGFVFSTVQAYVIEATDQVFRFMKASIDGTPGGRIENPPGTPVAVATPWTEALLPTLRWTQSADTMYLVQQTTAPRKLTRTSHIAWSLTTPTLKDGPYLDERTDITVTPSATSGSVTLTASAALFAATDVGRAIRLRHSGTWSWLAITAFTSTTQVTATVQSVETGSAVTTASASSGFRLGAFFGGNYPAVVAFFQQRLVLAATPSDPKTVWGSRTGSFEDFTPTKADGTVEDDHGFTFTLTEGGVNAIRWLSPGSVLAIGTSDGEFVMRASTQDEAITPTNVVVRLQSTRGSAEHVPVRIDDQVLYIARARRRLHEFAYNFEADRYRSPDMTLLARHVARPKLARLAWQADPWGVCWATRDDGALIGFTYLRDQDVTAWHRHPKTNGAVLDVCVVPGAGEDELWLVVERTIGGATKRFVERLAAAFEPDNPTDQEYGVFVDSSLELDNTVAQTLTPGAGATVKGTTGVGFTAGGGAFVAGDVGREIRLRWLDASDAKNPRYRWARARITGYTSATVVSGTILAAFPSLAAIAADGWHLTVTTVSGLDHLEGQTVQILADGAAHPDKVVSAGAVALDRPTAVAQVGLGYTSYLETVQPEAGAADGTATTRQKRAHQLGLMFVNTLGASFGDSESASREVLPFRTGADAMDAPPPLFTGPKRRIFPGGWTDDLRFVVEQTQPLPLTIAALVPRIVTND